MSIVPGRSGRPSSNPAGTNPAGTNRAGLVRVKRFAVVGAAALSVTPLLTACLFSTGGPGPTTTDTSGSISANYSWPSGGAPQCTLNTGPAFVYKPKSLTGKDGASSTVSHPVTNAHVSGPNCQTGDMAQGLRTGTWDVYFLNSCAEVAVSAQQTVVAALRSGYTPC